MALLPSKERPRTTRCSCCVASGRRSEEHTSELQSRSDLVCRLLLEKKKKHQVKTSTAQYKGDNSKPKMEADRASSNQDTDCTKQSKLRYRYIKTVEMNSYERADVT